MSTSGPGFFSRLSNLWKGFLSLWISDLEKEHPEIAYENSINSMIEKYSALKRATAAIIRRREDIEARLSKQAKELAQVEADLETAVGGEQDEIALILISKKQTLEGEVTELQTELEQAKVDGEDAKRSLLAVQGEINKLKAEKDRMLAKMESAKARIKVQEQLEGLSVDAEVKALDNVRGHIQNLAAQAKLGKELAGESLDGRLAEIRRQTGEVTAKKKLEELKQKREAAKAQAAQKTM
ncbi:MAG: PspA/IM30 family protein [Deltaproteobacteria bacterium]|nr:PspA/IM30 family protein [Deltaproteobacteria bacterium]